MNTEETRPSGANGTGLPLHEDIVRSADRLAKFVYGPAEDEKEAEANRRRIYHLATKSGTPFFKLGGVLCGRKSTILRWIEAQEQAA